MTNIRNRGSINDHYWNVCSNIYMGNCIMIRCRQRTIVSYCRLRFEINTYSIHMCVLYFLLQTLVLYKNGETMGSYNKQVTIVFMVCAFVSPFYTMKTKTVKSYNFPNSNCGLRKNIFRNGTRTIAFFFLRQCHNLGWVGPDLYCYRAA